MNIHFIGIGGIGMSGLALICLEKGFTVSGSDRKRNAMVERLSAKGATISLVHHADNIQQCELVVYSTAIGQDNPELLRAHERRIPCIRRCELQAELMRGYQNICISGSHGKTTTTALAGELLKRAHFDPLIINGGILNSIDSNINMGNGKWCVSEADESDGSFLRLPTSISIITNIDSEHLDYYGSYGKLLEAFEHFIENTSYLGCTIACIDDENVRNILQAFSNRRIVTYGFSPSADIQALSVDYQPHETTFFVRDVEEPFTLRLMGQHNVLNALAIIALARFLGIDFAFVRSLCQQFQGVQRRFTHRGYYKGAMVIDDYAHHPREISSTLQVARQLQAKRVIAIVEPHRFSRLKLLLEEYAAALSAADEVILMPVYAASESPIPGLTSHTLGEKLSVPVSYMEHAEDLQSLQVQEGDMLLFMGAGNSSQWSKEVAQ